ncbi:MAG: PASTA domain-containing protein [Anaerolineae bacterium]
MTRTPALFVLILSLFLTQIAVAQDVVTVPDLTNLSVPEAAAVLNRAGLALGAETGELWTAESGLGQNHIKSQSVPAGQAAARASAVDITVLRSPNVILLYDDNDLTLVNKTGASLDLSALFFNTLDGAPSSMAAARWGSALRDGQCTQVWSVGRNGPKGLDECSAIQNWLVTTNPGEHFWTGAGGTTRFAVSQNGIQRALCAVGNPGRCEFYLSSGSSGETTEYVYLAYKADQLAIINQSTDRWMMLNGYTIYNNNVPQNALPVTIADPTLYGGNINPVARLNQLAPGQCILFTNATPGSDVPPQPCDVIAQLGISPQLIFWGASFDMNSITGGQHSCPAATAGRLTICVMPL